MANDMNDSPLPLEFEAQLEKAEAEAKWKAVLKRGLASLRGTRRSVYMRRSIAADPFCVGRLAADAIGQTCTVLEGLTQSPVTCRLRYGLRCYRLAR